MRLKRKLPSLLRATVVLAFAFAGLVGVVGCGEGEKSESESAPLTLVQTPRSGSFLTGPDGQDLVLRGIGGAALLSAPGTSDGTAIATAKLFARLGRLAGPPPYEATLQGAEVNPLAYSLKLDDPRFEGRTGSVRWQAEVTGGLPESVPASFGTAVLTVDLGVDAATLRGDVVAAGEGDPVAGAQVTVAVEGLGLASGRADGEGRFEIGALPTGITYTVVASKPGFERSQVTADSGESGDLRIEIERVAVPE
ncbi:MAG: carboxypeptidase-like regulatory domain-containing protein [Solirubrobacterales bacterium]